MAIIMFLSIAAKRQVPSVIRIFIDYNCYSNDRLFLYLLIIDVGEPLGAVGTANYLVKLGKMYFSICHPLN